MQNTSGDINNIFFDNIYHKFVNLANLCGELRCVTCRYFMSTITIKYCCLLYNELYLHTNRCNKT